MVSLIKMLNKYLNKNEHYNNVIKWMLFFEIEIFRNLNLFLNINLSNEIYHQFFTKKEIKYIW